MERRRFLRSAFGYGVVMAGALSLAPSRGRGLYVRPPAAKPEDEFSLFCVRCGSCAMSCPTNAIEIISEGPLEMVGTPQVTGQQGACIFCYRCTEACPTQVLDHEAVKAHLSRGEHPKLGSVELARPERCIECLECERACPFTVVENKLSGRGEPVIRILRHLRPPTDGAFTRELARIEDHCRGCGHCVAACPTDALALRPSSQRVVLP